MENTQIMGQIAGCSARFAKVAGSAGSGKTQAIIERARALRGDGVETRSIVAFAATRSAADALASRLAAADAQLANIMTTTPQDYAAHMLSDQRAQAATGRKPRVLQDFEARILTEDLKVIGIKPKRMKEMLKFFFKQYSEMDDEREDFLLSTEERMLHDALIGHLTAMGAMLVQELTNVACKYVRDNPQLADAWRYDFVLADDWQDYSIATQQMLENLSKKQLLICGNESEQVQTVEDYPSAEGFTRFACERQDVAEFELEDVKHRAAAIVRAENEVAKQEGMEPHRVAKIDGDEGDGSISLVKWTLPNAEFIGIADYVVRRTRKGEYPVHPRDIFVSVPNALWGRAIAKMLEKKNIPSSLMVGYHVLTGDPRYKEKSASLRAFTGLNLAADPQDAVAWRDWCGFGDYLTHSNHWCRLQDYASSHGVGVVGMLDCLSASGARPIVTEDDGEEELASESDRAVADSGNLEAGPLNGLAFLGADVLVKRYRAGRDLIARCEGKRGFSLLNNIIDDPSAGLPEGFADLIEPVDGTEDARTLYERAVARSQIMFASDDSVRIGLGEMACGLSFDTVIIAGAVDGFLPSVRTFGPELDDDRKRDIRNAERRVFYSTIGKARRKLAISCFARDDANSAEALGMQVHRIRAVDGKRMAMLSPSCFIDEMGDALPGFDAQL